MTDARFVRFLFQLTAAAFLLCLYAAAPEPALAEKNRYVAAGVPAPDKPWTSVDYQQAATVLSKETLTLPEGEVKELVLTLKKTAETKPE